MFRDQPVAFPDDNLVLGCYLGPAIDVGPTLTAKILKANREVVYRSAYHALADVEQANAAHVSHRVEFDMNIQEKFGPEATPDDFPTFPGHGLADELAGDADDEIPTPSLGVDVVLPTPEASDNYVNASLMLPRGNSLVHGTVIG
jgi:hypothetical protein